MPRKPAKPCAWPGCPRLTYRRYCPEHESMANAQYNRSERPYDSGERYGSAWRKVRNLYIAAHPLCEECLKAGKMVPAEEVHHIKPLGEGGTNAEDNLMSLCKSCHSRITALSGDRWGSRGRR